MSEDKNIVPTEQPDNEPLLIVDLMDNVLGLAPKPEVHIRRLWHRQVYIVILNSRQEILLQKRSPRRQFDPAKWTTSVSGHVTGHDTYLVSAEREIQEELGLQIAELTYIGKVLAYSEADNQICGGPSAVFVAHAELDVTQIQKQESEVTDVAWFPIQAVVAALKTRAGMVFNDEKVEFAQDFLPVFEFMWDNLDKSTLPAANP